MGSGSKMASIYVYLSGRDMDKALLGIYGIKLEEKKEGEKLKPKVCPRCKEKNAYNAVFCIDADCHLISNLQCLKAN